MRFFQFKMLRCLLRVVCLVVLVHLPGLSWANAGVPAPVEMMNDTTLIECGGSSDYPTWIDNKLLPIALMFIGDSIVVTPEVILDFSFENPCNDTVQHLIEVFDDNDNLLFSENAVLIVQDITPPLIQNSLSDTLYLTCTDTLPDASSVTVSDNCFVENIDFFESSFSGGNCPVTDTIRRVWDVVDSCGNRSLYQHTIIFSDTQLPTFTFLPPAVDTVTCMAEAHPDFTGYPTGTDVCDPDLDINFLDQVTNLSLLGSCEHQKKIDRIWFLVDDCSNTNTYFQTRINIILWLVVIYVQSWIKQEYLMRSQRLSGKRMQVMKG